MRSPKDAVLAYNLELWNKQQYELGEEIIAEEIVRHEIGGVSTLSREDSLKRVKDMWSGVRTLHFTLLKVIAEEDLVTIVYQCDYERWSGEPGSLSSIEVFRVDNGQICEVWNAAHSPGEWQ